MKTSNRHFYLIALIVVIAVAIPGLYLMDRYDVPSLMLYRLQMGVKKLKLTISPIVVSDDEILESISASGLLPDDLRAAINQRDYKRAWGLYEDARARNATSSVLIDTEYRHTMLGSLRRNHPEELDHVLIAADDYTDDIFTVLGKGSAVLGRDFSWTRFPPGEGDVIFVWEVNTLQHLTLLAEARLITGEEKYFDAVTRHLYSWLDENPIENSVNWTDPMEVSLRLYSLLWTGELLNGDERMGEIFPGLVKTIYAHARHVAENIDRPRKRNNHGIFAAMGLYFASVTYPEFQDASEWKSFSEKRILDELVLQYTSRGVHKEFAPAYHLPLLDSYLHYFIIKIKLNEKIPRVVFRLIEAQVRFLKSVTDPEGNLLLIGDSSDHHFLRLAADRYDDAEPTLLLGALMFQNREFIPSDPGASWEAEWLLGFPSYGGISISLKHCGSVVDTNGTRVESYEKEGFVRVESGDLLLFCDFARFGAEPHFMGHNHCDVGSFVLWQGTSPIVIDPGTYTYRRSLDHNGVEWRDFLRSSSAHNVTVIDGRSQAEPIEDFYYEDWPEARLLAAGHEGDQFMAVGEHLAYEDLAGTAIRAFALSGRVLIVIDWFPDSSGMHTYEANFVLGTDAVNRMNGGIRIEDIYLQCYSNDDSGFEILKGSYDPPAGWRSNSYGNLEKTYQLRNHYATLGPAVIPFCFDFTGREMESGNLTMRALGGGSFAVEYDMVDSRKILMLLNPDGIKDSAPISYNGVSTDACISLFDGESIALIYGGTYFRSDKREVEVTILPLTIPNP